MRKMLLASLLSVAAVAFIVALAAFSFNSRSTHFSFAPGLTGSSNLPAQLWADGGQPVPQFPNLYLDGGQPVPKFPSALLDGGQPVPKFPS